MVYGSDRNIGSVVAYRGWKPRTLIRQVSLDFRALREIEKWYDIRLPAEYCSFVLDYPALDSESEQRYLEETISRTMEGVVIDNDFFRIEGNGPATSPAFQEHGWKPSYFVVGSDGCGNYYFLDTAKKPAPVYFFDHERETVEFLASDITGLLAHFQEILARIETRKDDK